MVSHFNNLNPRERFTVKKKVLKKLMRENTFCPANCTALEITTLQHLPPSTAQRSVAICTKYNCALGDYLENPLWQYEGKGSPIYFHMKSPFCKLDEEKENGDKLERGTNTPIKRGCGSSRGSSLKRGTSASGNGSTPKRN